MADERVERAAQVFERAMDLPPGEREQFVAAECGTDENLEEEVKELLYHHGSAPQSFLRPSQDLVGRPTPLLDSAVDARLGHRIGRYLLRSVIASGGMGTVYLAEQDQPRRDVALKVIRPEFASQSGLRRFEFESEFLARLDHPNVAHVYEAGVHEEQGPAGWVRVPYFAMQYVDGARTITDYARENGLGMADHLRLFLQVCEAVQHGHQKGIIHRDLKPANILVDGAGQVKVIDFGVARATGGDLVITTVGTGLNSMIGTPQYMSPEQCEGDPRDVDVRTDVYSLGVVLYELLCGRRPYDVQGGGIIQAARAVCETEPASPSRIDRRLRGDLEAIVLTALMKERSRRYQSVADMAADVRRYLDREPISVRPPSVWAHAMRWAARHPLITTGSLAASLAVAILFGAIGLVWLARNKPHEVVISPLNEELGRGAREVRVLSLGGNLLRSWAGYPNAIPFAHPRLEDQPYEPDSGRLLLLGFQRNVDTTVSHAVVAYDVDRDLERPAWVRRIDAGDPVPQPLTPGVNRKNTPADFTCFLGSMFDVFEESPGLEIFAAYGSTNYSQFILRIYDLRGELLYEVWHEGNIGSAHWMSNEKLLVLAGVNGLWTRRELGLCSPDNEYKGCVNLHPSVVFSIRPEYKQVHHRYIFPAPGQEECQPRWYLMIEPANVGLRVGPPPDTNEASSAILSVIIEDRDQSAFHMILGPDGGEFEGSRQRGNAYISNQNNIPDVNEFKLIPFADVLKRAGKFELKSPSSVGP